MKWFVIFIVALVAGAGGAWALYTFAPQSIFSIHGSVEPHFGTTVTTINGTDTISASRTTINNNFSALNTGKFELSDWFATTSAPQLTTLAGLTSANALISASALATVGTITVGTWNASVLTAQYGGTGSTTLSTNELFYGNGTGALKSLGWGTSGQLLTSNGSGSVPTWTSASFDTTQNYNFTGTDLFKNFNASSTAANPLTLNGLTFNTPAGRAASSTVLSEDGSGNLHFVRQQDILLSNNPGIYLSTTQTSSTTLLTVPLPANTIVPVNSSLRIRASFLQRSAEGSGNCSFSVDIGTGAATTTFGVAGTINAYIFDGNVVATSTNNLWATGVAKAGDYSVSYNTNNEFDSFKFAPYSYAAQLYLSFTAKSTNTVPCSLIGETVEQLQP